jgi:hypothetical protein
VIAVPDRPSVKAKPVAISSTTAVFRNQAAKGGIVDLEARFHGASSSATGPRGRGHGAMVVRRL